MQSRGGPETSERGKRYSRDDATAGVLFLHPLLPRLFLRCPRLDSVNGGARVYGPYPVSRVTREREYTSRSEVGGGRGRGTNRKLERDRALRGQTARSVFARALRGASINGRSASKFWIVLVAMDAASPRHVGAREVRLDWLETACSGEPHVTLEALCPEPPSLLAPTRFSMAADSLHEAQHPSAASSSAPPDITHGPRV